MSKEFAEYLHNEVEQYYGRKCDPKDMYYRNWDIRFAFEAGWDEATKHMSRCYRDLDVSKIMD